MRAGRHQRSGSDSLHSNDTPPDDTVSIDEHDALLTLAHGGVVNGGGTSVQRLLSVVTDVIIARGLGPVAYGVYALGWRFASMLLWFANGGADTTLLRDLQAYDDLDRRRRVTGLAYLTTAVASTILALGLVLGAGAIDNATIDHPAFPTVLQLSGVLLVVMAFVRMNGRLLRGMKSANGEVVYRGLLRPLARLVAGGVAVWLGYSAIGVVGVLIVAMGMLAVLGYPAAIAVSGIRPSFRGLRTEAGAFYDHALPSALSRVGTLLRMRIDVLLIGALLTATAAGIYNVVLLLVGLAGIPLSAFNQMMPPVASDLHSDGQSTALGNVYTTVSRLIVMATVPLIAVEAVFGRELLSVFGSTYGRGYAVLLVFLVGRFIANAVGATGILLSMTNHQYARLGLEWFLAISNVALTYLLVLEFGLIGAALGTSLSIAVQNLVQAVLLRRFEGLWPFDRTFLKPIGAGVGMGIVMVAVRSTLDGPLAVGIGALVGIVVYVVLLVVLGIESRDRIVVRELRKRYGCVTRRRLDLVR